MVWLYLIDRGELEGAVDIESLQGSIARKGGVGTHGKTYDRRGGANRIFSQGN